MTSQKSSPKVSRRPFIIRRVVGDSMTPTLGAGTIVVATRLLPVLVGHVAVAIVDGREVIKRVTVIDGDLVELRGDNPAASTDSRQYGKVPNQSLYGRVIFTTRRE